jgi:uncharacterized repeat protein (TIGR01451 family)
MDRSDPLRPTVHRRRPAFTGAVARLAQATVILLLAGGTLAGGAVLTTITVDGNMSDWSAVLAEPSQVSLDGPAGGMPDLDAPVQSTGRDLSTFAWTYDSSYFYLYTRRVGSAKNRQRFWYYLDFNADGLMSTGEPVFHVSWWGNKRTTETYLYQYNAANPGGDPLGDPSGQADGWTMAGTISGGTAIASVKGGSGSGLEMEARISWSALGVPPATPFMFHVASSNSANLPGQIDDNMGGPGGNIGSTFLAGVTLQPDRSRMIVSSGTAVMSHSLINTASGPDTFNLTWVGAGAFTPSSVAFFHDQDGDNLLGPGDTPLSDTDGDGQPDTGSLAAGIPFSLLVAITAPGSLNEGDVGTTTITAASSSSPAVASSVVDTLTVATPAMTLLKSVNSTTGIPGDVLTYTVLYTSAGSTDAYNAVIVDTVPAATVYVPGSASGTGTAISFSHDGGATFDTSEALPVTHIRWTVAASLAPGDNGTVAFQTTIQ